MVDGRKRTEKVGWSREGYTAAVAAEIRGQRMKQGRHGATVKTAAEINKERRLHDQTLAAVKEAYFDSERGRNLKGRTTDLNRFDLHLAGLAEKKVSEITEPDIQRLKGDMKDHAPATRRNTLELLRRLCNYGAAQKLCPPLSFTIKLERVENEVIEHLTPEEVKRLLDTCNNWPTPEAPRMLKIALFSGMRRGEIFNLQDKDVDFRNHVIKLRNPKGGRDTSIPLNQTVAAILKEQIAYRDQTYPGSLYIFPGKTGNKRTECKAVSRIKTAADLPDHFRIFHGLRHHLAVTMANSGKFTLDMIGELLTHKSGAMTKRYAQFLPDSKKAASDATAALIAGQAAEAEQ